MVKQCKCQFCGEYDDKELLTYIESGKTRKVKKYYHPDCLKVKERDSQEYQQLINFVCELCKIKAPTGLQMKQIKQYKEEYGYRYYAVQLALHYYFIIKDNKLYQNNTLGIVPYIMDEAKDYWTMMAKAKKQVVEQKEVPTKIQAPRRTTNRFKNKINMDDL